MMMSSICLVSKWNSCQLKGMSYTKWKARHLGYGVTFLNYYVTKKACRARALHAEHALSFFTRLWITISQSEKLTSNTLPNETTDNGQIMACCCSQSVCVCNFIGFPSHDEFRIVSRCSLQEHSNTERIIERAHNPPARDKIQESKRFPPKTPQDLPPSIRWPFSIWLLHPLWIHRRLLSVRS